MQQQQCSCKLGEPHNNLCCAVHGIILQDEISMEAKKRAATSISLKATNDFPLYIAQLLMYVTPDERVKAFSEMKGLFCMHCGIEDPNCQCNNDE